MRASRRMITSGFAALTLTLASLAPGQVADPRQASSSGRRPKTIDRFLHEAKITAAQHDAPSEMVGSRPTLRNSIGDATR